MSIRKIFKGDKRSVLVKKNIVGSFLVKGWGCVVQLLLVPATLKCLNQYEYGLWLTMSSILLWIDQFDIGLGNGLRNKLAEALAKGEKIRARKLVSTTFFMLGMIIIPVILLALVLIYNVDLYSLLNVEPVRVVDINGILAVSTVLVGTTFIFKCIGNVYLGLQLPAVNNLLVVAGQTLSLICIFVMSCFTSPDLMDVACIYTASPLFVYLLSWPLTFSRYGYLRPSASMFDKKELKSLFAIGMKFFVVQIAGLVIFASSNIIIAKILSPAEVTPYQVAYKYFSLAIMLFTLVAAPLWSATTDAYSKGDWRWIDNVVKNMRKVMLLFFVMLLAMLAVSGWVYRVWVGDGVVVGFGLSALMAAYIAVLIFSTCYSNILFGIGKILVITIVTVIEAVAYVPLALLLGNGFGLCGIVMALLLVNVLCAVCNKLQYGFLSAGTARGIWNK